MPLSGLKVVELGVGSTLAYCGKLFADFGADVVKIEPPRGDPGRIEPPLVDVGDGSRESAYFAWLNTNKRSITADLATRCGAARAGALVESADVLLDARAVADLLHPPLAHDALRAANPRLVVTAISWFGESGPYRDFAASDTVCRALAGLVKLVGPREGPPLPLHDHQADIVGGLTSFIAAMTGLYARDGDGAGRRFSISIHEANVALAEYQAALGLAGGVARERQGVNRFAPTFPLGIYRCREGHIGVTVVTPAQWVSFCDLLDLPALKADPDFMVNVNRAAQADEIEAQFAPRFLARTAPEWFDRALELRLPFAIVPDIAALMDQKVHRDRGAFATVRIGTAEFEAPILPLRLGRTPPRAHGRAPRAGAHDADHHDADRPIRASGPGASRNPVVRSPPLTGMRIVDLSMGWAGPLATRQMADLGADVIKVEACQYPDWWRGADVRPIFIEQRLYEKRPAYLVMNRNKRGITLDLTSPEGAALLKRLVKGADAVVENYSREVLPKLKLDYAVLAQEKPDLVMISMPAFGASGAWADCRAYGSTLEHASGLPSVSGAADGPPMMNHIAYGDVIGGLNAACALMIALTHRRRTGEGQHVDLSQVECMLPLVAPWIIAQSVTGTLAPRLGTRHPMHVPHGCFRCCGDDEWVQIAVTDDAMWQALCTAIGRRDLAADARLGTAAGRRQREAEIEQAIGAWTRDLTADAAMFALQRAGVAAGAARSPFELDREPHLVARAFWQPVERAHVGRHDQPSLPFREGEHPYPVRHPSPTLGEFNDAVLSGLLGLSRSELARLEAARVIGREALPRTLRKRPERITELTGSTPVNSDVD